jgi:hypothetical protein
MASDFRCWTRTDISREFHTLYRSSCLFDFSDGELAIHAIGHKSDLIADFDVLDHGEITRPIDHGHLIVHSKLFQWTVPDRDLS